MPFAPPAARAPIDRAFSAWALIASTLLACAALCNCGPAVRGAAQRGADRGNADRALQTASGDDRAEIGYLAPPRLESVARTPTVVVLMGNAAPDSRVELMAPEGEVLSAPCSHAGAWRLTLPAVARPRMFALAARMRDQGSKGPGQADRLVHSEGAVILLPHAGPPALLVRAGAGALVFAARTTRPALDALDYDPGGFSAAGGRARPGASVRLLLDGALAGVGQADAGGRFSILAANRRLPFGTHAALVQSADGQDERRFTISPPGPTLTTPYQVDPMPDGWRLEWAIPGGGVQTTLAFIPAG